VSLPEGAAIILHCIPIMTFESSSQVNIPTASDDIRRLRTIEAEHNLLFRHNLDGIVTYFNTSIGYSSYCQLYRNGILEAVDVSILLEDQEIGKVIRGQYLEHQLAEFCEKNIPLQRELGVNGPIYLLLSLVSVKGYRMVPKQNHYSGHAETKIDRDHLLLPEIMIDERDNVDWYRILHPLFDMLWNATGWPKCMDYDENGTWNPN
ncbi:MAG TPA: hypothetical protein VMC62_05825, partial [Longilinea sp.]|nr:hypothetical protein [Longilinea sp.]